MNGKKNKVMDKYIKQVEFDLALFYRDHTPSIGGLFSWAYDCHNLPDFLYDIDYNHILTYYILESLLQYEKYWKEMGMDG